jgi:hypothetical protein
MKRSSFWFLFLFICFLVGFLHGILPGNKDSLKIFVENSSLTQSDIKNLLAEFSKQESILIEFVEINSADVILTKNPNKFKMTELILFDDIKEKIHPDFNIVHTKSAYPIFWQIKSTQLEVEYLIAQNRINLKLIKNLFIYLTEWQNQIQFLMKSNYSSTLKAEPHFQVDKEKKASFLRSYDFNELKLKPL